VDFIDESQRTDDNKASNQSSFHDNTYSSSTAKSVPPVDLVIAWHVCGDLMDRAIDMALKLGAALVACPCSFAKMTQQPKDWLELAWHVYHQFATVGEICKSPR